MIKKEIMDFVEMIRQANLQLQHQHGHNWKKRKKDDFFICIFTLLLHFSLFSNAKLSFALLMIIFFIKLFFVWRLYCNLALSSHYKYEKKKEQYKTYQSDGNLSIFFIP